MAVLVESRQQKVFAFQIRSHRRVAQGYAAFLTDYTDPKYGYDASNPYELAAYWFGGMLTGDFSQTIGNGNQILTQTNIGR